jgi:serine phosphatase RsbU (regulator of sigma subunit)/PAS domain-containing protein
MTTSTAPRFEGLLAEAGRLLASSLELEETLRTVARLAVPEFADWCAVDIVEGDGAPRQVASGHPDPRVDALLLELRRRHRSAPHDGTPVGPLQVIERGEPAIFAALSAGQLPDATPEEQRLYEQVGLVSWLVVPLLAGGRAVGAISFLSTDRERVYTEQDFPVALELADRCALAVHNAQLYAESEDARALLSTVFSAAPVGMALVDVDRRYILLNERLAALNQRPVDAHLGRTIIEVLGPQAAAADALVAQVVDSGEAVTDVEIVAGSRAFLASYAPVLVEERVLGAVAVVVDTTVRHRAQQEAARLLERTRRLQAVTEQLSAALTAGEVATVIIQEGMAATGASCGVLGMREGDGLRVEHRLGIAGRAPGFLPLGLDAPMPTAARTLEPVLLHSRAEWLERFSAAPPRESFEAFAAVPLVFERRVAGVMGLGFPRPSALGPADVDVLLAIARQGAQALERARLYEERAYVARTLQAGLLPRALPAIPGLDLAVRYRPIRDGAEVGGDFYDVVDLDGGAWLAVVGDICGKGTKAAVLTGVMRSTVRALALRERDPVVLLQGVNEALLREGTPHALATMALALVRADGDAWTIELVAGGHPPALVLRADGTVEETAARGRLLGMQRELDLRTSSERLARGDLLLLYTDGIIDARPLAGQTFGDERLREALAAGAGRDADGVLAVIDAAVRAHAPGTPRDDKALLAIRPV